MLGLKRVTTFILFCTSLVLSENLHCTLSGKKSNNIFECLDLQKIQNQTFDFPIETTRFNSKAFALCPIESKTKATPSILYILDQSGSMSPDFLYQNGIRDSLSIHSTGDPDTVRHTAVQNAMFYQKEQSPDSKIGFLEFALSVSHNSINMETARTLDAATIEATVQARIFNGETIPGYGREPENGTNYESVLKEALRQLQRSSIGQSQPQAIIFVTDGEPTDGMRGNELLYYLKNNAFPPIYPVYLNNSENNLSSKKAIMESMAEVTGGIYNAAKGYDLEEIIESIVTHIFKSNNPTSANIVNNTNTMQVSTEHILSQSSEGLILQFNQVLPLNEGSNSIALEVQYEDGATQRTDFTININSSSLDNSTLGSNQHFQLECSNREFIIYNQYNEVVPSINPFDRYIGFSLLHNNLEQNTAIVLATTHQLDDNETFTIPYIDTTFQEKVKLSQSNSTPNNNTLDLNQIDTISAVWQHPTDKRDKLDQQIFVYRPAEIQFIEDTLSILNIDQSYTEIQFEVREYFPKDEIDVLLHWENERQMKELGLIKSEDGVFRGNIISSELLKDPSAIEEIQLFIAYEDIMDNLIQDSILLIVEANSAINFLDSNNQKLHYINYDDQEFILQLATYYSYTNASIELQAHGLKDLEYLNFIPEETQSPIKKYQGSQIFQESLRSINNNKVVEVKEYDTLYANWVNPENQKDFTDREIIVYRHPYFLFERSEESSNAFNVSLKEHYPHDTLLTVRIIDNSNDTLWVNNSIPNSSDTIHLNFNLDSTHIYADSIFEVQLIAEYIDIMNNKWQDTIDHIVNEQYLFFTNYLGEKIPWISYNEANTLLNLRSLFWNQDSTIASLHLKSKPDNPFSITLSQYDQNPFAYKNALINSPLFSNDPIYFDTLVANWSTPSDSTKSATTEILIYKEAELKSLKDTSDLDSIFFSLEDYSGIDLNRLRVLDQFNNTLDYSVRKDSNSTHMLLQTSFNKELYPDSLKHLKVYANYIDFVNTIHVDSTQIIKEIFPNKFKIELQNVTKVYDTQDYFNPGTTPLIDSLSFYVTSPYNFPDVGNFTAPGINAQITFLDLPSNPRLWSYEIEYTSTMHDQHGQFIQKHTASSAMEWFSSESPFFLSTWFPHKTGMFFDEAKRHVGTSVLIITYDIIARAILKSKHRGYPIGHTIPASVKSIHKIGYIESDTP